MDGIGVVHGRFQPIHLDHLTYILEGLGRCGCLYIGITNADPSHVDENNLDPFRSQVTSNPLSYWERLRLIEVSLQEVNINHNRFTIVPFPINRPQLLRYYVPLDATFFMTIYDTWGKYKRDTLLSLGLNVEVMWERTINQKGITGTLVRTLISNGDSWESLVPTAAANLMKELSLDRRIRNEFLEGTDG